MLILGIETSCDETAASLLEIKGGRIKILSNIVSSQIKIHQKYGGIVPEKAARKHLEMILPVIKQALKKANKKIDSIDCIDCIAVTVGPGLITSLLIGVETAKILAYVWQKPIISINHLEGHIYANWLSTTDNLKSKILNLKSISFPFLCLIVSGGHTELILMKDYGKYRKIGQTRDDAAGEAFDKVAKLLNLGYPGGPIISRMAEKGNPKKFDLPRPMINSNDFDFSFSGLKTAVLYLTKKLKSYPGLAPRSGAGKLQANDLCASFQQAVIDVLTKKTIQAAEKYKVKTILLGGGVAANKKLREQLAKMIKKEIPDSKFILPDPKFCTDNASMIACAGYFHAIKKDFTPWWKLRMDPNLEL